MAAVKPMRVAVTGANGHLGANTVRALLDHGHKVRALHRAGSNIAGLRGLDIETAVADVTAPDMLKEAFRGCDAVAHLAAVISIDGDPDGRVARTNAEGTRYAVKAALSEGVKRFVHVSSIHAFHVTGEEPFIDESAPKANENAFAYDRSKAAAEDHVRVAVECGLDAIIVNPTGILGPHDHQASLSGDMLRELYRGGFPMLVDGGFDFVDVRDVAEAICAGLTEGRAGENYLLSGRWADMAEIARLADAAAGHRSKRLVLPLWTVALGLPFMRLYSRLSSTPMPFTRESLWILQHNNRNCRHDKASSDLGYAPRPLEQTIRDTYQWNLEAGYL